MDRTRGGQWATCEVHLEGLAPEVCAMTAERPAAEQRLRVLLVTSWYPSEARPLEGVFVREQARAASLYDDVTVLHLAGSGIARERAWRPRREENPALNLGIPTFRSGYAGGRQQTINQARSMAASLSAIGALIRDVRPHVLHAHVFKAGLAASLAAKIARKPLLLTEHASAFARGTLDWRARAGARLAFALADRIVTASHALRKSLPVRGDDSRFATVPNVVDTELFHPAARASANAGKQRRLLSVCLLDPSHNKGVPVLLHALAQLRVRRSDFRLDLVGDGPARPEYEALSTRLGLGEHVFFLGERPKAEVAEHMRASHALVVSSRVETFSVVAAEALASGVPVVSTRCGGPEEFVIPEVGALCAMDDPQALAETIESVLAEHARFDPERIAEYARSRFSPEIVGRQLHALYGDLAGLPAPPNSGTISPRPWHHTRKGEGSSP